MSTEKTHRLGTEATTSSPADTDRVMVYDSSGSLRPVTFDDLKRLVRESILVGGRNLLTGTRTFAGYLTAGGQGGKKEDSAELGMKMYTPNDSWGKIYKEVVIKAGETYTFSAAVKTDNDYCRPHWENKGDATHSKTTAEAQILAQEVSGPTGEWNRVSLTIKCTKTGTAHFRVESASPYSCGAYKLERGNIPTDWTPAPEDIIGGGNLQCIKELRVFEAAIPPHVDADPQAPPPQNII